MKSGKCPKCGSLNVFMKQWGLYPRKLSGRDQTHNDYICTDCGYCESYYNNQDVLKQVANDWDKVLNE